MTKVYEVTLVFKSGAIVTFISGEFNLREGEAGNKIWDWTESLPHNLNLLEFNEENVDCVLKKEIDMPMRLS